MRNLPSHFVGNSASSLWHLPRNVLALCITRLRLLRLRRASGLFQMALVKLIELYQQTLSPDHGPMKDLYTYGYCRHSPTCSVYAKQKILERGAMLGSLLAIKRVLSCHPWKKLSDEKIAELIRKT